MCRLTIASYRTLTEKVTGKAGVEISWQSNLEPLDREYAKKWSRSN